MYRPVLVTAPTETPVSLAEAKRQVRAEDFTDDDDLLTALIAAATSHLDGWTGILGRCISPQIWRQDSEWLFRNMPLPLAPVISVAPDPEIVDDPLGVRYTDPDGVLQTIAPENYQLLVNDLGPFVRFNDGFSVPGVHAQKPAVSITYRAGYAEVPPAIKQAMLLLVSHWYENRDAALVGEAVMALPFAVDALITPFRRIRF